MTHIIMFLCKYMSTRVFKAVLSTQRLAISMQKHVLTGRICNCTREVSNSCLVTNNFSFRQELVAKYRNNPTPGVWNCVRKAEGTLN